MGVNIKNPETERLIRELATLTGASQTAAVTEAVRERLDRLRQPRTLDLSDQLMAIGTECARRLREPYRSAAHGDLLYGEDGLPQ